MRESWLNGWEGKVVERLHERPGMPRERKVYMSQLTPELLRASTTGTWVARVPQIDLPPDRPADLPLPPMHMPMTGISTDTRTIKPGNVFIALRGEKHDGHDHLAEAVSRGALVLVIDREEKVSEDHYRAQAPRGVGILKVADTGKALLAIAGAIRKGFTRTKVIAVCGSNGKTTTARLIHHVLSTTFKGTVSQKSFNNAVGVPLTILSTQPTDQFLVCEVGTNAPGEIETLAKVVEPDIAVITSIGREHLEGLGDLAGVAKEEAAILDRVRPKGFAVITADSTELGVIAKGKQLPGMVRFGRADEAELRLTGAEHIRMNGRVGLVFSVNDRSRYTMGVLGEHNALNAIAAIAVARRFNIDEEKIAAALASFELPELRMEQRSVYVPGAKDQPPARIIADCYNANPDSMLAAIQTLSGLKLEEGSRRVCILGDMLELGAAGQNQHLLIAERLLELETNPQQRFDLAVLVGEQMRVAAARLKGAGWSEQRVVHVDHVHDPDPARSVAKLIRPGDTVLLKGSRRIGLERVLTEMQSAEIEPATGDQSPSAEKNISRADAGAAVGAGAI